MSYHLDTFERMKDLLKETKLGGPLRQDLYTHLSEIFNRIMLHHPYDAYDKFEEISHLVKKTHLKIKDPKSSLEVNRETDSAKD